MAWVKVKNTDTQVQLNTLTRRTGFDPRGRCRLLLGSDRVVMVVRVSYPHTTTTATGGTVRYVA